MDAHSTVPVVLEAFNNSRLKHSDNKTASYLFVSPSYHMPLRQSVPHHLTQTCSEHKSVLENPAFPWRAWTRRTPVALEPMRRCCNTSICAYASEPQDQWILAIIGFLCVQWCWWPRSGQTHGWRGAQNLRRRQNFKTGIDILDQNTFLVHKDKEAREVTCLTQVWVHRNPWVLRLCAPFPVHTPASLESFNHANQKAVEKRVFNMGPTWGEGDDSAS